MRGKVLVVDASDLDSFINQSAIHGATDVYAFIGSKSVFIERTNAEENESYRQIIPYVTFITRSKIAVFQRNKGGDERLKHKVTVGIGGHINPCDSDFSYNNDVDIGKHIVIMGAYREIEEEIVDDDIISNDQNFSFAGLIIMNETLVDRVHAGIHFIYELKEEVPMRARGDELMSLGWMTVTEAQGLENLEKWTVTVLERIQRAMDANFISGGE